MEESFNLKRNKLSINLSVARSCFVRCKGCYNFFGADKENLSLMHIISFLTEAKKRGISKVTLCGGDPLSREDIVLLLQSIKNLGFTVNLDTVGTPLLGDTETIFFGTKTIKKVNEHDLARLVDLLGIPIDGADNISIQHFRKGRENIFNEQLQILDKLNNACAKICINTVVHKMNYRILKEIIPQIIQHQSIVKWQLFQFMPIGPLGYKNKDSFEIDDNEFISFANEFKFLLTEQGFTGEIEFKSRSSRKYNYLLIDSDGNAYLSQMKKSDVWDNDYDSSNNRVIISNIKNKSEYDVIFEAMFNTDDFAINSGNYLERRVYHDADRSTYSLY